MGYHSENRDIHGDKQNNGDFSETAKIVDGENADNETFSFFF